MAQVGRALSSSARAQAPHRSARSEDRVAQRISCRQTRKVIRVNRLVRGSHSRGWVLAFVLCARAAAAQSLPPAPSTTDNDVHFMPRAAFYLWAEKLSGED